MVYAVLGGGGCGKGGWDGPPRFQREPPHQDSELFVGRGVAASGWIAGEEGREGERDHCGRAEGPGRAGH